MIAGAVGAIAKVSGSTAHAPSARNAKYSPAWFAGGHGPSPTVNRTTYNAIPTSRITPGRIPTRASAAYSSRHRNRQYRNQNCIGGRTGMAATSAHAAGLLVYR